MAEEDVFVFPEIILLKILNNLSLKELVAARLVCKHWNNLVRSESLWEKFIPKWPGFVRPKKSAFRALKSMWKSSIDIGEEKWYPNPLPEIASYESRLFKAFLHQAHSVEPIRDGVLSTRTRMYFRLNPCYDFTNDFYARQEDMNEAGRYLWEQFRDKMYGKCDCCAMFSHSENITRKKILEVILQDLEPGWFLQGLDVERRQLDPESNIINASPNEDDREIPEDDLGDFHFSFENSSIFGSFDIPRVWTNKVNQRLPVHLYKQLRALFLDDSAHYFFNDGCGDRNYNYDLSLMVSDSAVFFKHIRYDA